MFVDDLRENCDGAEAVGMTAVLHRGAETTLPELERLLGVSLQLDPGQLSQQHRLQLRDARVEVAQLLVERLQPRVERLDVVAQRGDVDRQLVLRAGQYRAPLR